MRALMSHSNKDSRPLFRHAGDLQGEEMAQIFVKALPRISRFLKNHTKPFIAKIAKDGSVSLLF
jgi:hypothetical protein